MIFDIVMKLARKSMGSELYNRISYDWLGRRRNYERFETYSAIHRHYLDQGISFRGKRVVEVGTGLQYFTALHFLADGAARVDLVEPKLEFSRSTLMDFLEAFNVRSQVKLRAEDVEGRIRCFNDLSQIPPETGEGADLICSFTVLEHVRDLPGFFALCAKILKPGGVAYHMIDLSDHTYQVFARFPVLTRLNSARALYHLRYSPRMFDRLNDPKCYMNRVLMPDYLDLSLRNGFKIVSAVPNPYPGKVRIHPDLLGGRKDCGPESLNITTLALTLEKASGGIRGTAA